MAAFNRLDQWPQDLATAVHNLNTAALNVMLINTALVAANAKDDIAEIAAGNGYVDSKRDPIRPYLAFAKV
jgi:hypothetical protein